MVDEETWGNRETALAVAMCHVSEENRVLKEEVANLKKNGERDYLYVYYGYSMRTGPNTSQKKVRRFFRSRKSFLSFIHKNRRGWSNVLCDDMIEHALRGTRKKLKRSLHTYKMNTLRCFSHPDIGPKTLFVLKKIGFTE